MNLFNLILKTTIYVVNQYIKFTDKSHIISKNKRVVYYSKTVSYISQIFRKYSKKKLNKVTGHKNLLYILIVRLLAQ